MAKQLPQSETDRTPQYWSAYQGEVKSVLTTLTRAIEEIHKLPESRQTTHAIQQAEAARLTLDELTGHQTQVSK